MRPPGGPKPDRNFGPQAQPAQSLQTRPIPASGDALPVVGLGSWITFDVGNDPEARDACAEVVRAFFSEGGRLIDSSPMYGSSQPVIGHALAKLGHPATLFSAEKVWVGDAARGAGQMAASRAHWGLPRFDLMQVHNLLAWEEHLPKLQAMKAAGQLRYVGISTSEGRRHAELERILRTQAIDFVQLTYNLLDREIEQRLLPLSLAPFPPPARWPICGRTWARRADACPTPPCARAWRAT